MDFRHIQQFLVLAETLNFRRAAEKLHMAQPPLSVSIRKLEQELGVTLFDRGKDGVKLTKSGEAALEEAQKALFHANQFKPKAVIQTGLGFSLRDVGGQLFGVGEVVVCVAQVSCPSSIRPSTRAV